MEPFIAEIRWFPYVYDPRGWVSCDGRLMAINTNAALFSLLGTMYGGNGQTTFALPNLTAVGGPIAGQFGRWCIATQGVYPQRP